MQTQVSISVHSVDRLLDTENSPFDEPHLHEDVGERIWQKALEHPKASAFHLKIAVPASDLCREQEVCAAIKAHFLALQNSASRELTEIFREGRYSAVIGLGVVILLLMMGELLQIIKGAPYMMKAISESLVIFGWVVMWHPSELLLYAHIPVRRNRKLATKLAAADITLETH